jgi:hypothetical protein
MSELKVNKVTPRSGTTVTLGDSGDSVAIPSGVGFNGFNHRNIVINGDMSIAQRSTSVASITSTGYYTVDRMNLNIATGGTWTQSQDTDVPTGQGFATSSKLDCTTANAALSAGSYFSFRQKFEGQNLQYLKKGTANAVSTTLSFWVKSNKTGIYCAMLFDNDNSRAISKSFSIDVTNTWEKKTITYAGDTTGTLGNDNAYSLSLEIILLAGTNYTSGTQATSWESYTAANVAPDQTVNLADNTANEWYITGVQLEAGTSASDFEFLPVDVNLARCQRYCQQLAPKVNDCRIAIGELPTNNRCDPILKFSPEMRAAPSFTFSAANTFSIYSANLSTDLSSISLDSSSSISGNLVCNVATTPFTGGQAGQFITNGTSSSILASAEL